MSRVVVWGWERAKWAKAASSWSWAWMKEWAMVPDRGMPQRIPARTLEVPLKPAM